MRSKIALVIIFLDSMATLGAVGYWSPLPTAPIQNSDVQPALYVDRFDSHLIRLFDQYSTDGGESWIEHSFPDTINIELLENFTVHEFFHDSLFVFHQYYQVILRSYNGGESWVQLPNPPFVFFDKVSLCFVPDNPGSVWASTTYQGVWFSDDLGENWVEKNNGFLNGYVNRVVVHPSGIDTMFASSLPLGVEPDSWVYKSVDRGESWDTTMAGLPWQDQENYLLIKDVSISTQDPNTLYLVGRYVDPIVFKSNNNGSTWEMCNAGIPNVLATSFMKLQNHSTFSDVTYLAAGRNSDLPVLDRVLRTIDSGETWSALNGGLPLSDESMRIKAFDITHTNPAVLFVSIHCDSGRFIYEYTDTTTVEAVPHVGARSPRPPQTIELHQAFPNPFNPTTTIEFTLPYPQDIQLTVYNVQGQRVAVLAGGMYAAGIHRVTFNTNLQSVGAGSPRPLSSGVYIYQLTADDDVVSRKMVLVR